MICSAELGAVREATAIGRIASEPLASHAEDSEKRVRLGPVLPPTMLARRMLTRLVLPRRPRCIREINQVQLDKPPWSSVQQLPRWRWSRTVSARLDHKHRMPQR